MNVLVGVEGSDESVTTLERTLERTVETGDNLTVAIIDKPEADRSVETMNEYVTDKLEESQLEGDVHVLDGDPGSALVEFAERGGFDQLVIGGGTVSPMGKIRLGPITEFVLLNASMTVTLVR